MRIAIVIATAGRAALLAQTAKTMLAQTRPCDVFLVVGACADDVAGLDAVDPRIECMTAERGLCAQRNAGLSRVKDRCDAVIFFDDDFVPSTYFVAEVERVFAAHSGIAALTGILVDDGVRRGGIAFDEAAAMMRAADASPRGEEMWDINHVYGCNMALRMPIAAEVGFDARLPLYGWQEDRDFSRRLAAHGRIVRTRALVGVHLGTTKGRSPGLRLGYSQVSNPLYLLRKGTMKPLETIDLVARNIAANTFRSLLPEPWVDRAGRLRGNLLALYDALRGRITPERILEFS